MTCNQLKQYGPLAGRILLAFIFIMFGLGKLTGWDGTLGHMASADIPMVSAFLVLTISIGLGGGLMLALGFQARRAAGDFPVPHSGHAGVSSILGRPVADEQLHEKHRDHGRHAVHHDLRQRALQHPAREVLVDATRAW